VDDAADDDSSENQNPDGDQGDFFKAH
jgi:hypothetical protein